MIGLTGAHRTGKTTLAKAWAERNEIEFITPNVKGVIAEFGKTCDQIDNVDSRIEIQRRILQACRSTFLKRRKLFITDRTPLDVAAYTIADAGQNLTDKQSNDLHEIVLDCIDLTNSSFYSICLLQPGIPFVEEKGSPLPNVAYMEHIHTLASGFAYDERVGVPLWVIARDNLDLESRIEFIDDVHGALIEDAGYDSEGATIN